MATSSEIKLLGVRAFTNNLAKDFTYRMNCSSQ